MTRGRPAKNRSSSQVQSTTTTGPTPAKTPRKRSNASAKKELITPRSSKAKCSSEKDHQIQASREEGSPSKNNRKSGLIGPEYAVVRSLIKAFNAEPVTSPESAPSRRNQIGRYTSVREAAADPCASSEIKAIDEFFRFNPGYLFEDPEHIGSEGQKEPQFYDRHFNSKCVLERVVYCPEIETDLRDFADKVVLERLDAGALPPIGGNFPTEEYRYAFVNSEESRRMIDENSVVDFYEETTAKFASTVAATLHFRQDSWTHEPLQWKPTHPNQGSNAIADGFLKICKQSSSTNKNKASTALPDSLASGILRSGTQVVITWEFKSLKVGTELLAVALLELTKLERFPWTPCEFGHRNEGCKWSHKPATGTEGDFATNAPKSGPDAEGEAADNLWSVVNGVPDRMWKSSRRKRYDERKMAIAREHALHLIQQAWAQATKLDVTLFVLNVGQYEFICRRNRREQFLYISNVIIIGGSDYGQLHTGLFLAGIRDAEIRMSLKLAQSNVPVPPRRGAGTGIDAERARVVSASCRNELVFHLQEAIRKKVCSGTGGLREAEPYFREPALEPLEHQDSSLIRVQVTEHIHDTSVFRGILYVDNYVFGGLKVAKIGVDVGRGVIIKVANTVESVDKLEDEYLNYTKIADQKETTDLIPKVFGLFRAKDIRSGGPSSVLLMENAGACIKKAADRGFKIGFLQEPFKDGLDKLHRVAQLLHGDIRSHHLVARVKDKRATCKFISLGKARRPLTDDEESDELKSLEDIFPEPKSNCNSFYTADLSSCAADVPIVRHQRVLRPVPLAHYPWISASLPSVAEEQEDEDAEMTEVDETQEDLDQSSDDDWDEL